MADSYLKIYTDGLTAKEGYKLFLYTVSSQEIQKGVSTVDASIPNQSSDLRILVPISGLKEDFNLTFELIDDGTKPCYSVDNAGSDTELNLTTIKDQLLFLKNNIIGSKINTSYEFYDGFLDETHYGWLTINGGLEEDSFFNAATIKATFKKGANILGA